jgi:hypothetical protein
MVLRLSRALSAGAAASFYISLLAAGCTKADDPGHSACEGETCIVIEKCATDLDCDWGYYCGPSKECMSDCVPGGMTCPEGSMCSNLGKCVAKDPITPPTPPPNVAGTTGIGGFSSGGASGGRGGSAGACAKAEANFEKVIPNIMLVVDRSLSMQEDFGGNESRWNVLREALIDPTNGLVAGLEADVRFGLTLYTSPSTMMQPGGRGGGGRAGGGGGAGGRGGATSAGNGGGGVAGMSSGGTTGGTASGGAGGDAAGMMCPWLVEVPVALNNLAPISAVYLPDDEKGFTPTGQSLAVVWPKVAAIDETLMPGPKFIILATDGNPNTCSDNSAAAETQGKQASVDAITAAKAAGITTYVISVGTDVAQAHLREIANLGQGFPATDPTDRFYVTTDTTGLVDALNDIIVGVRPCDFELDGTVKVEKAADGTVTVNGTALTFDDPNGWSLTSPTHIQLNGTACDLIREGNSTLSVNFPCDVFIPKIPE